MRVCIYMPTYTFRIFQKHVACNIRKPLTVRVVEAIQSENGTL